MTNTYNSPVLLVTLVPVVTNVTLVPVETNVLLVTLVPVVQEPNIKYVFGISGGANLPAHNDSTAVNIIKKIIPYNIQIGTETIGTYSVNKNSYIFYTSYNK
jgi:hypothetical protein